MINHSNQTAADIMEGLIENGTYPTIKNLKHRDQTIKKTMENKLKDSDSKRHEFKKHGLVAKFVSKKISEIDYEGLNEYLYNLGLLVPIVKIDHKKVKKNLFIYDQLKAYQFQPTSYVKPNFNKKGKSLNSPAPFEVDDWKMSDLALTLNRLKPELEYHNELYDKAKSQMLQCPELQQQRKLVHEYGSVSLVDNDPLYDVVAINEEMGEDILIKYGKPNEEKVQNFILKGTLTKADIDQFKTMVDIRLDFTVMSLEAEKRMLEMLNERHNIAAQNYMRA
ncbi:hypothetical protein NC797_07570 [Aquibacillus sp. 3ASR75-11]|uniref:Uncharacterized protein n=1 Tax=Terrihalobacillus insolitus TaxID=2950438 RepID=A0A9X3WVU4_9BACI|nr:hypothetical protein [Terrihalobacillus insolitus]MDC3424364.1 hypothetical protein [Terrihalobacillus insolitus]